MKMRSLLLTALLALMATSGLRAADSPHYEYRAVHDPNGTGKFYMGREIAQVMGAAGSEWLDRPTREEEEQPQKLINALRLRHGEMVADIGAGSGYMSFRMASRILPGGKVFAEDIQPELLNLIRERAQEKGVTNIVPVLGTVTDPKLAPASLDLILMVDVYHEFDHPWEMGRALVKALKPGGRMVFVEYRLEDPAIRIKTVHKMSVAQVRREMSVLPLHYERTLEILPLQHIIVFRK